MNRSKQVAGSDLLQRTRKGVFWIGVVMAGSKLLTVATTLVLTRILSPSDFGLVAIASIVMAALAIFTDFGLGAAIIHSRADRQRMASTAFFIMPIIGLVLYLLAFLTAPWLADLLGNPSAVDIIRLATINILISSFIIVPSTLLEKDMAYRRKAIPDLVPTLVYIVTAFTLASQFHLGAYSIVLGWIAQAVASLILNWLAAGWRPTLVFDRGIAGDLVKYGKNVFGGSLIGYLVTNLDNVLVSRAAGAAALGYYTLAYSVTNIPATHIADVIGRVLFPSFVELRDDPERLRRAYLRALRVLIIVTFPMLVGLAAVAGPFVHVIMGEQWAPIIPVIQLMIVFVAVRVLSGPTGSLFMATNRSRLLLANGVVSLTLQGTALFMALFVLQAGIVGAAAAISVAAVLNAVFLVFCVGRIFPHRLTNLIMPLIRLTIPAVVMGVLIYALQAKLPATVLTLLAGVVLGMAVYVATLVILNGRGLVKDIVSLISRREVKA